MHFTPQQTSDNRETWLKHVGVFQDMLDFSKRQMKETECEVAVTESSETEALQR